MKGFSPWPGMIIEPKDDVKKPSKKPKHFIYFFGSENYAWVEKRNLQPYFSKKDRLITGNKTITFKEAVDAIEKYIAENDIKVPEIKEVAAKFNHSEEHVLIKKPKSNSSTNTPKSSKNRCIGEISESKIESSKKMKMKSFTRLKESPFLLSSPSLSSKTRVSALLDRPVHIQRPATSSIDVSCINQTLKDKKIEPSTLKFGFLGLGIMGAGIVKNILKSGHNVMVWDESSEKCIEFVTVGAKEMMTPSDVIAAANITFSCVSDPQVAKNMVFGNCGVLQGIAPDKGYVEMTGIDSKTSQDIAKAINGRGGRFLETQVQGNKTQAEEGTLIILAAGDRALFDDCRSCFQSMGKNSFYLGEVGNASKMNLVLQVMSGVTLAGMALADRAGLQQKDVLEIMELTSLACPLLIEKGKAIIEGGFPTQLPLQHMQKDLRLGMLMGDNLKLPLSLTTATNELYKHAFGETSPKHNL